MAKKFQVSPLGTVQYAWVDKPSTKFLAEGEYSISMILPKSEVSQLEKAWTTAAEAEKDKAIKETPKNAAKIRACVLSLPFEAECDEKGQETGNVVMKFKNKAVIEYAKKDGTKDKFNKQIGIFDSKGKAVNARIGRGSKVKVAFDPNVYVSLGLKKYGVSLRLEAVQVIEFVEIGSGAFDAGSYGFGEEAGWEGSEETPGESIETPATETGPDPDPNDATPSVSGDF